MLVQRTYGKSPSDLGKTAKAFAMLLSDLKEEDVNQAMENWLRTEREFPTPADIRKKINPEPVYRSDVYAELKRRQSDGHTFMTDEQKKYMDEYVNRSVKGC